MAPSQSGREALWKGKVIQYRPGRLHIALRRGVTHRSAYNYLIKMGCHIEFDTLHYGLFEVSVPDKDTLRLADFLSTSTMFRYVEPDIINEEEKENFN